MSESRIVLVDSEDEADVNGKTLRTGMLNPVEVSQVRNGDLLRNVLSHPLTYPDQRADVLVQFVNIAEEAVSIS